MAKKDRDDYKYYNVSIRNELRILFEAYIRKNPNLGYKTVSKFIKNLLQTRAEEIIKENPELGKIREIKIDDITYILQKNGKYKKFEEK